MKLSYLVALIFCIVVTFEVLGKTCHIEIDSGDYYYRKFDNEKALSFYKKALDMCKGYESLMKTTRALNDVGEDKGEKKGKEFFEKAIAYSDTMQKLYPDSVQSYFLKAASAGSLALYQGGRTKVQLARTIELNCKKSIALDSNFAPAYVVLGIYYRQVAIAGRLLKALAKAFYGGIPEGTLEDSKRVLLRAQDIDKENMFAFYELGQTYHAMDNDSLAKEQLKIALSLPDVNHRSLLMKEKAKEFLKKWK